MVNFLTMLCSDCNYSICHFMCIVPQITPLFADKKYFSTLMSYTKREWNVLLDNCIVEVVKINDLVVPEMAILFKGSMAMPFKSTYTVVSRRNKKLWLPIETQRCKHLLKSTVYFWVYHCRYTIVPYSIL